MDRPTREQVDTLRAELRTALDEVDHPNQITVDQDALIEILDRLDEQDAGHAAEVRALRAELEATAAFEPLVEARRYIAALQVERDSARAALAARTPQPAEPGKTSTPRRDDHAEDPYADRPRRWPDRADREGHGADQAAGRGHRSAALAERERTIGTLFEAADSVLERLDHGHGPVDMDDLYVGDLRAARDQLEDWHAANVLPAPLPAVPDGEEAAVDEMEGHFIDANERMGEALVAIGMALGLPRPCVGATWGAPEILARIAQWNGSLGSCYDHSILGHDDARVAAPVVGCSDCLDPLTTPLPAGEDVPARLEAAAEALEVSEWFGSAANLRAVASALRDRATSHDRAAVAAALVRPTGAA